KIYRQYINKQHSFEVDRAAKTARVQLITGIVVISGLKITNLCFSTYYYFERNRRYPLASLISILYYVYFALINSFAISYVVSTFYLLARASIVLFEQIYIVFRRRVIIEGRTDLIRRY